MFVVKVDRDLYEEIKEKARLEGTSLKEALRKLIRELREEKGEFSRRLRERGEEVLECRARLRSLMREGEEIRREMVRCRQEKEALERIKGEKEGLEAEMEVWRNTAYVLGSLSLGMWVIDQVLSAGDWKEKGERALLIAAGTGLGGLIGRKYGKEWMVLGALLGGLGGVLILSLLRELWGRIGAEGGAVGFQGVGHISNSSFPGRKPFTGPYG